MRRLVRLTCLSAMAVVVATSASAAGKTQDIATPGVRLDTGVIYVPQGSSAEDAVQFQHIRAAGAKFVRINSTWSSIAPEGAVMPTGFVQRDPTDPNYDWRALDTQIKAAVSAGLEPILSFVSAPIWAEGTPTTRPATPGGYKPNPTALANFASAAALHYGGGFPGIPRVRYWSVWNEPNLNTFLSPQTVKGRQPFAAKWYRSMLNPTYVALHAVHSDNVVIAGDTAPFGGSPKGGERTRTMPLFFMEQVLCVSDKKTHKPTCNKPARFDVWAHHPYSEGGPLRHATLHGDVSLGDMANMRDIINAAIDAGHVQSQQQVRLWATEFSWDTNPPDPLGVPASLEARWISRALYEMWNDGVSLLSWYLIRDDPYPDSYYQSGLYYRGPLGISTDRPKPALRAFRFPFVAFPEPKKLIDFWGRTPNSKPGTVVIQRDWKSGGVKWKTIEKIKTDGNGIFQAEIDRPKGTRYLRARLLSGRDVSIPFALTAPKQSWTGCVFGSCGNQGG